MIAFLAALLLAPAPPVDDTTITVTAPTPLSPAAVEARAGTFMRSVLPRPSYGQYGRWGVPVCIKVSGITDDAAARVAARVRAVATGAGMAVAPDQCRPNLNIIFTEDGRRTAAVILQRRPGLVEKLPVAEQTRLAEAALPVRWWYGLGASDRHGTPAAAGAGGAAALASAGTAGGPPLDEVMPIGPDAVVTSSYNSSLIDTNMIVSVTSATAIVDVTLATGKSLDAVADHVAMVTLAPTRLPPDPPGVPSILALFTAGDSRLSAWDKAYLAALARMTPNRNGDRQRRQLIGLITARMLASPAE
jgi:hypothetical protein